MPDVTPRLKAAQDRRAKKRASMEKAWAEMVGQAYDVETALTSLHRRAKANNLAPNTVRALERAQKALAEAIPALEDDECKPPVRVRKVNKAPSKE